MRKVVLWRPVTYVGFLMILLWSHPLLLGQESDDRDPDEGRQRLALEKAVMCESILDQSPKNEAVNFPISIGTVFCFTSFDPVPKKMFIYHHWFRRDRVSTRIKLALNPPRWSTYSSVRLREEDKGPWRVEVKDEENNLLQTLRFSITD